MPPYAYRMFISTITRLVELLSDYPRCYS